MNYLSENETYFSTLHSLDKMSNNETTDIESKLNFDTYNILKNLIKGFKFSDALLKIELESDIEEFEIQELMLNADLVKREISQDIDVKSEISKKSPSELSYLLKKHGVTASGKLKKLIKLTIKHVPDYEFKSEIIITEKGKTFLEKNKWIDLYENALWEFEFNDFHIYAYDNDKDALEIGINYIDEHIKLAKLHKDYTYLDDCLDAKELIYLWGEDLKSAFESEIKYFIHRLNPQYYSYDEGYLRNESVIVSENIKNIKKHMKLLDIDDLDSIFNNIWNSGNFGKKYMSEKECLNYLKCLINEKRSYSDVEEELCLNYLYTPESMKNIGIDYYIKGNYDEAADFFEKCIRENYMVKDMYAYKALSYFNMENYEKGIKMLDKGLEIDENYGRLWNYKGLGYFELDDKEKSKQCFKKAQELSPDDMLIWIDQSTYWRKDYNNKKALECLDKACELSEDNIAPYLEKANVYKTMNEIKKAEECLKIAGEMSDKSVDYLYEKGLLCLFEGDLDESIKYLDKCLEINNMLSEPWLAKSEIYKMIDENEKVKECMKKAVNYDYYTSLGFNNLILEEYFK